MSSTEVAPPAPADDLDARYGRTPGSRARTRLVGIVAAAAIAVVFIAWVIWAGLVNTPASFQAVDQGYRLTSEAEVEVQFSFTAEPQTTAACAVQALNEAFGIVGWTIVDLPASESHTRVITQHLYTSEQAVTGLVHSCWLT